MAIENAQQVINTAIVKRRLGALGKSQNVSQSVVYTPSSLSNGTDLSTTYREPHVFPSATFDIRLVYGNYATNSASQAGPGNAITITSGFEYNGVTWPVTFNNGNTSAVIQNNGYVISDTIPIDLPAGATAYIRSCPTVTTGQKWNKGSIGTTLGSYSAANSDLTTGTGALANAAAGQSYEAKMYSPVAIFGSTKDVSSASVCVVGDSIAAGTGDNTPTRNVLARGMFPRGIGFNSVWMQQGVPSSTAATRVTQLAFPIMTILYSNNDYAVCNIGTNDLAAGKTAVQLQSLWIALWGFFKNRGIPIWQTTILPKTTSTDNWATTTNQTFTSVGENSNRIACNDWLRGGAPVDANLNPVAVGTAGAYLAGSSIHPLTGYIELADVVEVNSSGVLTRNGGYWRTNGLADSGTFTSFSNSPYAATDTSKTWTVNQYQGKMCYFTGGTGAGVSSNIVSNTSNSLTFGAVSTAPDATTTYIIVDSQTMDGVHPCMQGHISLSVPISTWATANIIPIA
jgi:hypothetical protein